MLDLVLDNLFHWYRLVGLGAPGSRVIEPPGVLAAVVPAARERSVVNAVVQRSPDRLAAAYEELETVYAEFGAAWTVWVQPEGRDEVTALLQARGHVLDGQPLAMARPLTGAGAERPPAAESEDWSADGELGVVMRLNDAAYGLSAGAFAEALTRLPEGAVRVYVVRQAGEPVGGLLMVDHPPVTSVELVAVLPHARGAGLSGRLLAHALADAEERGLETATLIASKLGRPVYERRGFEPLEPIEMWERRPRQG